MYACLPVCAHVFISLHLSLCVCMCVYMCVYMERDIGRCVVKEKPLVTYPHGHIEPFTQLFLTWHSFDTASSSCNTTCLLGTLPTCRTHHVGFWKMDFL